MHLGRTLDRTPIAMLIDDLDVRVIHAITGEIPHPHHRPQPPLHVTGKPIGGPSRPYGSYGPRKTKPAEP